MTETEICNLALSKISGAGDQESGTGFIASINGTDRVSVRCKFLLPHVRRRVYGNLAKAETYPKETLVFTDLGAEATTELKMGGWDYVFNVSGDTIAVVRQIDEAFSTIKASIADKITEYSFQIRLDDTTMKLFTNHLSNTAGDSAFIERMFDQKNPGTWSDELIDTIATLLGSELCPTVGAVNKERERLLAEYKTVSLPDVQAFIQNLDNDYHRTIPDYLGGRNKTLSAL